MTIDNVNKIVLEGVPETTREAELLTMIAAEAEMTEEAARPRATPSLRRTSYNPVLRSADPDPALFSGWQRA